MENINNDYKKNSVSARDQVKDRIYKFRKSNNSFKVLFIGNSITLHEYKPEIGWYFNHGMAASKPENDYVHLVVKMLEEKVGEVSYDVMNIGFWELDYKNEDLLNEYLKETESLYDLVIFRFGENIPKSDVDYTVLDKMIQKMMEYYLVSGCRLVVTDEFWQYSPVDKLFFGQCRKHGGQFITLSDLGYEDKYKAIGMTNHNGINQHPNDLGMKLIAERIFEGISKAMLWKN